eukprot:988735-Alexandrium_andersonii.AAC.1
MLANHERCKTKTMTRPINTHATFKAVALSTTPTGTSGRTRHPGTVTEGRCAQRMPRQHDTNDAQ